MGRKAESRNFEKNGFKAEILGATTKPQLWINGNFYMEFKSLTDARLAFMSYARRHENKKAP